MPDSKPGAQKGCTPPAWRETKDAETQLHDGLVLLWSLCKFVFSRVPA